MDALLTLPKEQLRARAVGLKLRPRSRASKEQLANQLLDALLHADQPRYEAFCTAVGW